MGKKDSLATKQKKLATRAAKDAARNAGKAATSDLTKQKATKESAKYQASMRRTEASRAQRGALIQKANEHVRPVTEARKSLGKLARDKGFFKTIAQYPQLLDEASVTLDPKLARHATARATR